MKIYLDCGANIGETVAWFREKHGNDYEIYCFEANPKLKHHFQSLDVYLIQDAVWNADGETIILYEGYDNVGSTVMDTFMKHVNSKQTIRVNTIDFSMWIQKMFAKDDEIIIKMNIEGAEYPVLEKMIHDRTFEWVDRLYVQFHGHSMEPVIDCNEELIEQIKAFGTEVFLFGKRYKTEKR